MSVISDYGNVLMVLILLNFETRVAKVFGKILIFIWYLIFNDQLSAAYTRELVIYSIAAVN